MKKVLTATILITLVLVSIGLATAGNLLGSNNTTGECSKENCVCDGQGKCIYNREGNCVCNGQCNAKQCCNQNLNNRCLLNNNLNGCCKSN